MTEILFGIAIIGGLYAADKLIFQQDKQPIIERIKEDFEKLGDEYRGIPIFESSSSSYTKDKSSIHLCLRNPEGRFYSYNTLIYVALHELAHVKSESYSVEYHNEEFNRKFEDILRIAVEKGIYDPSTPLPPVYCGVSH